VAFLLAELAAHRRPDDGAAAERHQAALSMAEELGMRPLAAHCHAALARLYRRGGKPDEARAEHTAATTMYREMDMRFWLEKAEAETGRAG
jgi:predicted RNA polymerase sigma factor